MIKLAIFDLAGTTIKDNDDVARCLVDALGAADIKVSLRAANDLMGIPKPKAIRGLAPDLDDESIEVVHQDFRKRAIEHYKSGEGVTEVPGTSEVFRALKAAGIKIGIETGFDRETTNAVLGRMNWGSLIDGSAASDEVEKGRPHGNLVRKLMHDLDVSDPLDVMKVGDTPVDLGEGMSAGCKMVVGVLTGAFDRAGLEGHPHTHLVESVRDVPGLLGISL